MVISKYAQGCKEGKNEIMRPAFHKDAIMYGYLNGSLSEGTIENLYGAVDSFGSDENAKTHIDVLSIEGTAATAPGGRCREPVRILEQKMKSVRNRRSM